MTDKKPSSISQCMLNAAAMMETDANQYTAPQELSTTARRSIANCNRGQAALLRKSAEMADRTLDALLQAQRFVNAHFIEKPEQAPLTVDVVNAVNAAVHELQT